MIVGSIKEDLSIEKRVSITPESAKNLINLGITVYIEKDYASHISISDKEYENVGAKIKNTSKEIDQINLTYNPILTEQEAMAFGNRIIDRMKEILFVAKDDQSAIRARNRAREAQEINQFNGGLAVLVLIIGMGTLIAGVVGISNIMIFIVKERTKEIGIRKALGATPNSIVLLIILESIFITSISGYIGLLIGGGILKAFNLEDYWITDPQVSSNLVIAATITLIVSGTIAGYIPAKRAAGVKPIIALRDE